MESPQIKPVYMLGIIVVGSVLYSMSGIILNSLALYGTYTLINKYDSGFMQSKLENIPLYNLFVKQMSKLNDNDNENENENDMHDDMSYENKVTWAKWYNQTPQNV